MNDPVSSILRGVARKLTTTRATEAFAIGAIAAAAASASLMAAWILAGPYRLTAVALTLLPVVPAMIGLSLLPRRIARRFGRLGALASRWEIGRHSRWMVFAALAAACLAGCVCVAALGRMDAPRLPVPHWLIPAALVPLAGLLAAATVIGRGVSLHEAAVYIDIRGNLGERLTTALELSKRPTDGAFAATVQQQAVAAVKEHQPQRLGFWRRTRSTLGVLGLTLLACGVLTFISPLEVPGQSEKDRRTEASRKLAEELDKLAKNTEKRAMQTGSPQLQHQAEQLRELAKAALWGKQPEKLMSQLSELQEQQRAARAGHDALTEVVARLKNYRAAASLAESVTSPAGSPRAAAARLAEQAAGMDDNERKSLRNALSGAADVAGGDPQLERALREAAAAVDNANAESIKEAMNHVGAAMGEGKSESAAAQAMGNTANELERIKNDFASNMGGGLTRKQIEQAIQDAHRRTRQGGNGRNSGRDGGQQEPNNGSQNGNGASGNDQGARGANGQDSGRNGQGGAAGAKTCPSCGGAGGNCPTCGGSGKVATGAGTGSTNLDNPGGPGGRYEGPGSARGRFVRVYDPRALETRGPTEHVPGTPNPAAGDPAARVKILTPGSPTKDEPLVEYAQAWRHSRQRAEEDLSKQKIPARLKQLIRNYYGMDE